MAKITKDENDPVVLKNIKFLVGAVVYLKTDPFQYKRLVTGVHLTPNGYLYELVLGNEDPSVHYDVEIATTRDTDMVYNPADGDD